MYTDGDEVAYADRRPIILTSIEPVATRGDLADRTIAELDRIRPGVLAALLDAVGVGLGRRDAVHLERSPRMADFALWVVACEPSLPWKPGAFFEAYAAARDHTVQSSIDADPVATALVDLVEDGRTWEGTAAELLADLDARREVGAHPTKGWPGTPQAMGGRLTRAAPSLRASGWDVERGEGRDRYTIYLRPKKHKEGDDAHTPHNAHTAEDHREDVSTREQREHVLQFGAKTHDQTALDLCGPQPDERNAADDWVKL